MLNFLAQCYPGIFHVIKALKVFNQVGRNLLLLQRSLLQAVRSLFGGRALKAGTTSGYLLDVQLLCPLVPLLLERGWYLQGRAWNALILLGVSHHRDVA